MRGIMRLEKNKERKLKGSRKRKEAKFAETVSGVDFKIDTTDSRFSALLDGTDDRFGIDKTDPSYKETSGMRELLSEQVKRRAKKRNKKFHVTADVVVGDSDKMCETQGALALSSLVKSLKSKVKN